MKNRITPLKLAMLSTELDGWNVTMDPRELSINLDTPIANGIIKLLLPIVPDSSNKGNLVVYYQIDVLINDKRIVLGDLVFYIYEFYNILRVTNEDVLLASTSPDPFIQNFVSLKQNIRKLRFNQFLGNTLVVKKIEHVSNNFYKLLF
jgi:hypothetical protein